MSPNGEFTEILIPTASSSGIAAGPDGNIWFTESDRIGRVDLASLCSGGPQQLCLQQAHFGVEVEWSASNINQSGQGQAKPMTADTGAFWFFQPSSIELVIKVLDGRAINGHFWVFYGALTNVGYTITVTDTTTGTFKKYVNPEGQLASVADTEAF